jgi:hypothetical protein
VSEQVLTASTTISKNEANSRLRRSRPGNLVEATREGGRRTARKIDQRLRRGMAKICSRGKVERISSRITRVKCSSQREEEAKG